MATGIQHPFLKWAGSKRALIGTIKELLPTGKRLIEPFVGSGAVFLNSDYAAYTLNDINRDLIKLYKHIKRHPQEVIELASSYFTAANNTKIRYYHLREQFNHCEDELEKSALFIYLNRHGYNGLCRYNSKGYFNVPFGLYKRPTLPIDAILTFSKKAKSARFSHMDFEKVMNKATPGDVIYCDPPYVPLSKTAKFIEYHGSNFDTNQHKRLAKVSLETVARGITVLISNHDTAFTQQLYQCAKIHSFDVKRYISCKAKSRNHARELLALFS